MNLTPAELVARVFLGNESSQQEHHETPGAHVLGQSVGALVYGPRWNDPDLSFSFPDATSDYNYNFNGEMSGFSPFSAGQARAARLAIDQFAAVSGLSFHEKTGDNDRTAVIKLANTAAASPAHGYYPGGTAAAGDIWFDPGEYGGYQTGSKGFATLLHEIGHSLGLKHGHEALGGETVPLTYDSHEYSLMTYRSYVGAAATSYTNAAWGGPQTLMMLDIAALQQLYGANYQHNSGPTRYVFDPDGGLTINGDAQAVAADGTIFMTIWDGGGRDQYDFSAYRTDLDIRLKPGQHSDLDIRGLAQRAELGTGSYADGHVYNALLHGGSNRSLIENAKGGAGDDRITGNAVENRLVGGGGDDRVMGKGGDDRLIGRGGDDRLIGGDGDDILVGGRGADMLRGGAGNDVFVFTANGDDDRIADFRQGDDLIRTPRTVDGFADLTVSLRGGHAEVAADGWSVLLHGVDPNAVTAADFLFA